MLVIHTPKDGDEERYDLDALTAVEGGAIERELDCTWAQVEQDLRVGSATATLAVLWVFRKRKNPSLKLSQVDVPNFRKTLTTKLSTDEVVSLVNSVRGDIPEDEAGRKEVLDDLRELAADPDDVDLALEAGPKD